MLVKFLYKLIYFLEYIYPKYEIKIKRYIKNIVMFIYDVIITIVNIFKVICLCTLAYSGIVWSVLKWLYKIIKEFIIKTRSKLSDDTWINIFFALCAIILLIGVIIWGSRNSRYFELYEKENDNIIYYTDNYNDEEFEEFIQIQNKISLACKKYDMHQISTNMNDDNIIYYYMKVDNLYIPKTAKSKYKILDQNKANNCLSLWSEISNYWNYSREIILLISDSSNTEIIKFLIEKGNIVYL